MSGSFCTHMILAVCFCCIMMYMARKAVFRAGPPVWSSGWNPLCAIEES
jgi:hypothetical protein